MMSAKRENVLLTMAILYDKKYSMGSIKLYKENKKKCKRKVQGVPQSQTAALPRHQEEEDTDKSKQTQIEQMYEKH